MGRMRARALTLLAATAMILLLVVGVAVAGEAPIELKKSDRHLQAAAEALKNRSSTGRQLADLYGDYPGYIWLTSHMNGGTYECTESEYIRVETHAEDSYDWGYYYSVIGIWDTQAGTYVTTYETDYYMYLEEDVWADVDTSGLAVSSGRYQIHAFLWDDINSEFEDLELFDLTVLSATVSDPVPVKRIAGSDRYGTAAAIARRGWDPNGDISWSGVEHIVIANGEPGKESDPLSAAGLAGIYDAPVLTVQATKLPSATKTVITEIARENPGVRVHIVGGTSVVPDARWNEIKRIPGVSQVKDRFAGRDRFETSALMATRMVGVEGADAINGVILIAGDNPAAFYDALAASPIAYAQTMPMLSVQKTQIPTSVRNVLNTAALKDKPRYAASSATYIGSVPAAGALRMTTTSNRYTAATQITKFAAIDRDWTSRADTALASKLPDALTGGAFLGRVGGIMLFTDSAGSIQSTSEAFITGNKDGIVNGWVIGGTSVVPKAQETSFRNLLN